MLLSLLPDGIWSQLGILFVTLLAAAYFYSRNCLNYWKYRGIPYIAGSFPFGCIGDVVLQKRSITEIFLDFYDQMKGHKYIGIYSFLQPQLIVKDLDIIKNIFVKDFSNFTDRGIYSNQKVDPLMGNLFFMEGQPWKKLRAKLSPTFTSGKMKIMYETMKEKSLELQKYCLKASSKSGTIDAKDFTVRYGLDVISSTALGLEGNNFNEYNTDMRDITQEFTAPSTIQLIRTTVSLVCRDLAKLIQLRLTSKKVEDYFFELVKKTVEYRKHNNVKRNDFMQLLIELNNNNEEETTDDKTTTGKNVSLTLNEMAAQSFVFVVAGYETTSVTLGFCLYELAMNPQIQEKLISEIDEAGEDIQYDELNKLPYMHMVVNETLRKHPPVTALQRECAKDYTLPDGKVILAGTQIMIPMLGIHRDPELFPNPLEFNPERFSKENSDNIKPYSFMPFGEGPRICIGYRFAYMQVKTGLHSLLSRFTIELCEKTPIDLKLEKKTFIYNVEGGMWLRLKDRKAV